MELIHVINKWIPFAGFKAITIIPYIFIRKGMAWAYDERTDRHEHTHGHQQVEMLVVGILLAILLAILGCGWWSLFALPLFFYWYGIEYLIRLCIYRNHNAAYKNVAFEQEAYDNQDKIDYNDSRKLFAWIKYYK